MKVSDIVEGVAGPKNCWPGYRKVGTQPGTGKNAGKRVNDCEKIKEASGHIPTNKKEAEDPRWSNAITVDIGPDEDKKQASKMGFNISDAGPPKLNANGKF